MAKASTKTPMFELQSRQSGEKHFVTERAAFKHQKISGSALIQVRQPQKNRLLMGGSSVQFGELTYRFGVP
jgi:hypothetical protein